MSETKQAFSIDKPGAYKLRGGGIADILGVNAKSAFGWLRSDTSPMSMRRWDRTGVADAGCWDIIAAIPFVVDGPGRYMMRNGGIVTVTEIARDPVAQPVTGMDRDYHRTWYINGDYHIEHQLHGMDLVRKMHPLEQEPGAKASEEQKAPEIKKEPKKPTVAITHLGKYRARNGFFVDITHIGQETAIGVFYNQDAEPFAWLRDGRFNEHCESDEDIVEMVEQHVETKTLDPVAKWSEEAMQHIEEYVGIMKKEGKPMDPLIEEALRVFRPDLCPPKAGQEKSGAEVMEALGKAAKQTADEPKKRSAGFDLVIIRLNEQKCMLVVGDYENDDGDVKVRPIDDLDPVYVQRKCPDAIILQGDSYVMCPDTSISCVVHYGGEE